MGTFIFVNTESLLIPQNTYIKSFRAPIMLLSTHLLHSWMSCSGKNWKVTDTKKEELGLSREEKRQEPDRIYEIRAFFAWGGGLTKHFFTWSHAVLLLPTNSCL